MVGFAAGGTSGTGSNSGAVVPVVRGCVTTGGSVGGTLLPVGGRWISGRGYMKEVGSENVSGTCFSGGLVGPGLLVGSWDDSGTWF